MGSPAFLDKVAETLSRHDKPACARGQHCKEKISIGRADPSEPGHCDLRFSTQAGGLV
jgi:hypothetical protein